MNRSNMNSQIKLPVLKNMSRKNTFTLFTFYFVNFIIFKFSDSFMFDIKVQL